MSPEKKSQSRTYICQPPDGSPYAIQMNIKTSRGAVPFFWNGATCRQGVYPYPRAQAPANGLRPGLNTRSKARSGCSPGASPRVGASARHPARLCNSFKIIFHLFANTWLICISRTGSKLDKGNVCYSVTGNSRTTLWPKT